MMKFKYKQDVYLCAGDIADLMLACFENNGVGTQVVIKKSRTSWDSDLMISEVNTLFDLKHEKFPKDNPYAFSIPKVFDAFPMKGQYVTVLEAFHGFFDCEGIRQLGASIDGRTLAWMWKRLVGLLSWVHHFGYIHGAILPPHVMFWPDGTLKDERTHSVRLVDWCYSVKNKNRLKAWVPDYKDFYPPEVINKHLVGPWTDLYMGAKTMLYLCGGDVKKNKWPARIPGQMVVSLNKCLQPNNRLRPQTASECFAEFTNIVGSVYGPRKFHEFKLPGV